jgi:hypothetical protein
MITAAYHATMSNSVLLWPWFAIVNSASVFDSHCVLTGIIQHSVSLPQDVLHPAATSGPYLNLLPYQENACHRLDYHIGFPAGWNHPAKYSACLQAWTSKHPRTIARSFHRRMASILRLPRPSPRRLPHTPRKVRPHRPYSTLRGRHIRSRCYTSPLRRR